MRAGVAVGCVVVGAAVAAWLLDQAAQATAGEDGGSVLDAVDVWGTASQMWAGSVVGDAMQNQNVQAFLSMIAVSEGTAGRGDYAACYGYRHTIQSFDDHPAVTGEWRGEPLDSLGPRYKGKISTAAGRYQIIKPTWLGCKRALGLRDFGAASQDAAAVQIIKQTGALQAVIDGRFGDAVAACAGQWASLPGSTAGQGTRKMGDLQAAFLRAGGVLA